MTSFTNIVRTIKSIMVITISVILRHTLIQGLFITCSTVNLCCGSVLKRPLINSLAGDERREANKYIYKRVTELDKREIRYIHYLIGAVLVRSRFSLTYARKNIQSPCPTSGFFFFFAIFHGNPATYRRAEFSVRVASYADDLEERVTSLRTSASEAHRRRLNSLTREFSLYFTTG